jgi:hypothetical protein
MSNVPHVLLFILILVVVNQILSLQRKRLFPITQAKCDFFIAFLNCFGPLENNTSFVMLSVQLIERHIHEKTLSRAIMFWNTHQQLFFNKIAGKTVENNTVKILCCKIPIRSFFYYCWVLCHIAYCLFNFYPLVWNTELRNNVLALHLVLFF